MRRLRPLTEAECYARCYGGGDENVRIVRRQRRPVSRLSGERLRRMFEERLDRRDADAEAA